jgi:hypothetical protein
MSGVEGFRETDSWVTLKRDMRRYGLEHFVTCGSLLAQVRPTRIARGGRNDQWQDNLDPIGYLTETFKAPLIYNPDFEKAGIDGVVVPMGVKAEGYRDFWKSIFRLTNVRGALARCPTRSLINAPPLGIKPGDPLPVDPTAATDAAIATYRRGGWGPRSIAFFDTRPRFGGKPCRPTMPALSGDRGRNPRQRPRRLRGSIVKPGRVIPLQGRCGLM